MFPLKDELDTCIDAWNIQGAMFRQLYPRTKIDYTSLVSIFKNGYFITNRISKCITVNALVPMFNGASVVPISRSRMMVISLLLNTERSNKRHYDHAEFRGNRAVCVYNISIIKSFFFCGAKARYRA
jgi:hypothetical protein